VWELFDAGFVAAGLLMAAVFALFALRLRSDPIMTGLALNLLAGGLTIVLMQQVFGTRGAFVSPDIALFPQVRLPFADALPLLGRLLGGNNWLFFLAYLSVPVLHVMLYHTRVGLRIRAVGEYPAAALSPWRPSSSAARRPWACCWRRCSSAWPSRPPSASKARAHQRSSS